MKRGVSTAERQRSTVAARVALVALAVRAAGVIVIFAVTRCAPTPSCDRSIWIERRPLRAFLALSVLSL